LSHTRISLSDGDSVADCFAFDDDLLFSLDDASGIIVCAAVDSIPKSLATLEPISLSGSLADELSCELVVQAGDNDAPLLAALGSPLSTWIEDRSC
jgi:hypothetical protein